MSSMTTTLVLMLVAAFPLRAQDAHAHQQSPYADLQTREIKALSAEEMTSLLEGEGMGFALAAELNGYPGPKHVLELADSLQLGVDQRRAIERIRQTMSDRARTLGARIVEAERMLDRAFATGTIDEQTVRRTASELGRLRGDLRAAHLEAHVALKRILTAHQVHRYQELRGYAGTHGDDVSQSTGRVR